MITTTARGTRNLMRKWKYKTMMIQPQTTATSNVATVTKTNRTSNKISKRTRTKTKVTKRRKEEML